MDTVRPGFGIGGLIGHSILDPYALPDAYSDEYWMQKALLFAMDKAGIACPNPQVGCVLVKDGQLISYGATEPYGKRHAERVAVEKVKDKKKLLGATAYVTLEPCCHEGKQPPCVDLLIASGIKRCVIGLKDPFGKVSGRGLLKLEKAGIIVETSSLEAECRLWHYPYLLWAQKSCEKPVFFAKWAQTLDGHLADDEGSSKWITGKKARAHTHFLRQKHDAIMVGAGTVLQDAPALTVRDCAKVLRQPLKIIFDPSGRLLGSEAFSVTANEGKVLWLLGGDYPSIKEREKRENVLACCLKNGGVEDIVEVLTSKEVLEFWGRPIGSVFVEGGSRLFALMFEKDMIDGGHCFITPGFLGGDKNRIFKGESGGKKGLTCPDMKRYQKVSVNPLGGDILLEFVRLGL